MLTFARDCFAREELTRRNEYVAGPRSCDWCGQTMRTKSGRAYLYRYGVWTDGGRKSDIRGLFCSNDCRKSFHA